MNMQRDPRNPDPRYMVSSGSTHPYHGDMRKILVLLKIESVDGPIFFVVEGVNSWPLPEGETLADHNSFYYEESTCPTNFIRIPLIAHDGDLDPHGVFDFVDAVWMMDEYLAAEEPREYLAEIFPQITGATVIDGHLAQKIIGK